MPKMDYDKHGAPILRRTEADKRSKPQRQEIRLGVERFKLIDDDGRVLGPAESLSLLLEDGPISESQFQHLAAQFDDPNVLHSTAERLGVTRRKREDGSIELLIPPVQTDDTARAEQVNATDDNHTDTLNLSDRTEDDNMPYDPTAADALTPVREAQRKIGAPVIGSGLKIVKDPDGGSGRYVHTRELNAMLARAGRGGRAKGAGQVAADAVSDAQKRRAQTNPIGQANDRTNTRSRRYGRARDLGRD